MLFLSFFLTDLQKSLLCQEETPSEQQELSLSVGPQDIKEEDHELWLLQQQKEEEEQQCKDAGAGTLLL